ncbi:MAG: AAA family ATPase [Acidobacteria bacterium]|nr:AAA family ATPase [Acidobacteriota bacterium]MBV9184057.1 AAA family ATPase [Acidobacteriota bacterium]
MTTSTADISAFAAGSFAGRTRELARFQEALDDAQAGKPRVLLLAGEAGSGKSTLLAEVIRRAETASPPFAWAIGECSSATGAGDAYLPFRDILKVLTGDAEDKPQAGTNMLSVARKVLISMAPELINVFIPGSKLIASAGIAVAKEAGWMSKDPTPAKRPTELDQEKIFRQYTEVLQEVAKDRPLLIALDDLQWSDASSIALFFHIARQIKQARILLIGTYRPNDITMGRGGERHPLEQVLFELKRYFGDLVIDLGESTSDERRAFIDQIVDSEPNRIGESFRVALLQHTNGHPLFTVELVRYLREQGCLACDGGGNWTVAREVSWSELPPRIEGVIGERIGRLENELREILTVASVGTGTTDFLAQIVAQIQNVDERRLLKLLSADLTKRHGLVLELSVHRRGRRVLAHYRFAHALVQQYLYGSLSDAEKMLMHGDVAALLEEMYEGDTDQIATDLAYHYDQAGDAENALRYLEIVLDQALRMSGYREALVHATRALELIDLLPNTPERAKREFILILRWSVAIKVLQGWAAPVLKPRYDHARELTRQFPDCPEATQFLFALWTYYLVRCDLAESLATAAQCLEVAERIGSLEGVLAAHTSIANSAFWSGDLATCAEHTRKVIELYPCIDTATHRLEYGMDAAVIVNQFEVWIACLENRFDDARNAWTAFLPQAEALNHPFSLVIALNTGAWMYQMTGDHVRCGETADRLLSLARSHGFPSYQGLGVMSHGWASSFENMADGISEIRSGFEKWRTTAGPLVTTYYAILYADALLRAGRRDEAASAIDGAVAFADEKGEKVFLPLLMKIRETL